MSPFEADRADSHDGCPFQRKWAVDLQRDDYIANVGRVTEAWSSGAFVHVYVLVSRWDATTGVPVEVTEWRFFHQGDEVIVEV